MARVAVICGTGMSALSDEFDVTEEKSTIRVDTDWGEVPVTIIKIPEGTVAVIDRHHSSEGKRTPPHKIEHRANIMAVSSLQVDLIISINSVGSMRDDMPPGTIGITIDVLDLAVKPWTFFDDHAVHFDRTSQFNKEAMDICMNSLSKTQGICPSDVIVAQCVGPQFESPSEISALERLGADTVGMTLGPESRLVSEIGTPYLALACSSNWAAGRDPNDPEANIDHSAVDRLASTMRSQISACIVSLLSEFQDIEPES